MKYLLDIDKHRFVGSAFKVIQPKWSDDKPARGGQVHLGLATGHIVGGTSKVINVALDNKLVMSLNVEDARQLGIALIGESDRWS